MRQLVEFLGKFSFRVAQLAGLVAVMHSPTLSFVFRWVSPVVLLGLLSVEMGLPLTNFQQVRKMVVRFPYQSSSHLELAVEAGRDGDYGLAENEYWLTKSGARDQRVLGTEFGDIEKNVFPREWLELEIGELEDDIEKFPGHRDLLLRLAVKYGQVDNWDKATETWERAEKLDPNNTEVIRIGELLP